MPFWNKEPQVQATVGRDVTVGTLQRMKPERGHARLERLKLALPGAIQSGIPSRIKSIEREIKLLEIILEEDE